MKIVKNLSVANIRKYEGFVRREDLDFSDDGNYFRGFEYKGMPITTLRSGDTTYLSIRVDYLSNQFTFKDWMNTTEYKLCDMFNGVSEFDIDVLVENLEKVIAKVSEMNAAAETEVIDMTEVMDVLLDEIACAESIIDNFKANFKWYDASQNKLFTLISYLKNSENEVARAKAINVSKLSNREKKEMVQRLNEYGYVRIRKNGFYLTELTNAMN